MQIRHTYPPDSAGRLMTEKIATITERATMRDVEQYLLKEAKQLDTIDYIYATDEHGILSGIISMKELFTADREVILGDIMTRTLITARARTDQERIGFLSLKHNIKAIPVVDSSKHLLGVVRASDILRILDHEATDNLSRMGGIVHGGGFDTVMTLPVATSVKRRLPWLLFGLLGGVATAWIIGLFEELLTSHLILVAFIPLIVYLAGVIGTQMTTLIVRDLAVDPKLPFFKYVVMEARVVVLLGGAMSVVLFATGWFVYGEFIVGIILALSLMVAAVSSLLTSVIVPFALHKAGIDPANAGGPVSIIFQDMITVAIYLSISLMLLGSLV